MTEQLTAVSILAPRQKRGKRAAKCGVYISFLNNQSTEYERRGREDCADEPAESTHTDVYTTHTRKKNW